jgi:hypothetical protein
MLVLAAGTLLIGLPGAIMMELIASPGTAAFKGDKAWPAALHITTLMPIGIVLSAIALGLMKPDAGLGESVLWAVLGYVLAGFVVTSLFMLLG